MYCYDRGVAEQMCSVNLPWTNTEATLVTLDRVGKEHIKKQGDKTK